MPTPIPSFLLPRGGPSIRTLLSLTRTTPRRHASSDAKSKQRVLEKPDKFRPPSHGARRATARGPRVVNYPGPRMSDAEKKEKAKKQYPHMFPAEGTVMYKFLTNRGIHVWIAFGVLTSLATFTFTTTFKANTPFAHLLPSWSDLIWHPFDTLGQAITVYKMDVEHKTIQAEEKRLQKFGDAYRQHRYRVAHGIKDGPEIGPEADVFVDRKKAVEDKVQQKEEEKRMEREHEHEQGEYVDFEGNRKPVKKWLGIW